MFKSVFRKTMRSGVLILLSVIIFVAGVMSLFLNNYVKNTKFEAVKNASRTIEGLTGIFEIEGFDSRAFYFYINTLSTISDALGSDITVINSTGDVFASTNQIKKVAPKYSTAVLSGKTISKNGRFGGAYDKLVYIIGIPIEYNGQIIGGMFFNTELPQITGTLTSLLLLVLATCAIALILAAVLLINHTRHAVLTPLRELNTAVLEIASGNFKKRLPARNDEIGQLSSSFNHMASSLEQIDNTRSQFISDVSHELRTPMTSITGFVGGILDGTIPPEKSKEYLQIVYDESLRLTKLTNDMLEISKMNAPQFKLDVTEFDINELLRLCIIQLEQKISDKNLELDVSIPEDKLMVLADKNAIQRVMINLLDNAVKFSYSNTTITISITKKATKAYVSFGNLGIGIEEKDLTTIFDRFYKTDKSRSNDKLGAGLGLSLVKNIIKHHNQQVWAESIDTGKDSKFTKFTFTLELA